MADYKAAVAAIAAIAAIASMLGLLASPAAADVRAGVEAWDREDYAAAVQEWQEPADAGDADAMFNLAQAYRLGRGVDADMERAEQLYARAAGMGHVQAADAYGLILAERGRMADAMPYIRDAARRGDPRAQYVLGVSYFNGDAVEPDEVRAYALMTLSNEAGLPQAGRAIAEMDQSMPEDQRREAVALAAELAGEASRADTRPASGATSDTPDMQQNAEGAWRLQLGAFSVAGNADRLWRSVSTRPELAGKHKIVTEQGRLEVLSAGGYVSRADAADACEALRASGQDCLVTRD